MTYPLPRHPTLITKNRLQPEAETFRYKLNPQPQTRAGSAAASRWSVFPFFWYKLNPQHANNSFEAETQKFQAQAKPSDYRQLIGAGGG